MFDKPAEILTRCGWRPAKRTSPSAGPSDEQWIERGLLIRVIQKKASGGSTETEVINNDKADLKLYQAIKAEDAPEMSGPEATRLLDAAVFCEVRDTKLGDDDATIVLGITGGWK